MASFERILNFPRLVTIMTWVFITGLFYAPVKTVLDNELDSSNYASYTYFAAHKVQYGPEVVPMAGPYGYVMYGFVYNGELYWSRFIWQIISCGAIAALLLWFFQQSKGTPWRWIWLVSILLLSPLMEDLPYEWAILISGLFLLRRESSMTSLRWRYAIIALLAFISLMKGTHLILTIATLTVVLIRHLVAKDSKRVLSIVVTYIVVFLAFWLLAGQHFTNISVFIRGIRELANGYNQAMALDETTNILINGLIAFALMSLGLAWAAWHNRKDLTVLAGLALFAGFTFVKWKHGFVRADGHIYVFFHYVTIASMMVYLHAFRPFAWKEKPVMRWGILGLLVMTLVAAFKAESPLSINFARMNWIVMTWVPQRIAESTRQLIHPIREKAALDAVLQSRYETFNLPLTRQEIGRKTVDFFGVQHGIIQLNKFNYHPRPMGGGNFNVYNAYLMQLNRDFLRDPLRRPAYYLSRLDTIDNRVATMDDGMSLLDILYLYEPVMIEQYHTLLKARPGKPVLPEPKLISRRNFKFGDYVPAPAIEDDQMLLARFDLPFSWRGNLRSLLYKTPLLFMSFNGKDIERPESRRIIPSMVSTPFLLSPVVENNADYSYLYSHRAGKQVNGFFIYTGHPECFEDSLAVEFYTVPKPPVSDVDVDELMTAMKFPITNVEPNSISPKDSIKVYLQNLPTLRLLPPGEMSWTLKGNERELIFDYGYIPEAYERGTGNGANYFVEIRQAGQPPLRVFSKFVDPNRRPEDRGNHTARVLLPPVSAGSKLVIMTDPGEYGDTAWDWTYLARINIKRGPFALKQFPTFNRAPSNVEGDIASVVPLGDEKVFILHVPGTMTFDLNGKEKSLSFEYGFMPGAYTGEGNTAGAIYSVEKNHPGGAPEVIFRRELRPVTVPSDRGRQVADIDLSSVRPGDSLIVKTGVIQGSNNSWGWTYLTKLKLQ